MLIVGSQALCEPPALPELVRAVERLGLPVFLTGMARGLMGADHRLQMRHRRSEALQRADLVVLAGMPCDFRLDYGRSIGAETRLIGINRSASDLKLNRRPDLAMEADCGQALIAIAAAAGRC